MTDAVKLPIADLVRAAERELAMRERVYPGWVRGERMTADKAAHEIQAMRQIAEVMAMFQRFEVPLRDCIRQRLADLKEFERHPAVENVREAFPDAELIINDLSVSREEQPAS
jgi:hypothetical protein